MKEAEDPVHVLWITDWVKDLYHGKIFQGVMEVWNLRSESNWELYTLLGFEGMTEQKLLEEARLLLNDYWTNNYPYRERKKNVQS